jgi:hypothetical protein
MLMLLKNTLIKSILIVSLNDVVIKLHNRASDNEVSRAAKGNV